MRPVSSVMTAVPVTLQESDKLTTAARTMRDNSIGAVMVTRDRRLSGLLTDRDIVTRVLAAGSDPAQVAVGEVCTRDLVTVRPGDDLSVAVQVMREHAVRRVPVVEDGRPAGLVSIGDLAVQDGQEFSLGDIFAVLPRP